MPRLLDYISTKTAPYYRYISITIVVIVFIIASFFAYKQFVKPKLDHKNKQFSDVANNGENKGEVDVYLFHVDWCPHCKKALPEWESFREQYNGKPVNGFNIHCQDINCTNDEDPKIQGLLKQYKVDSYPTVVLQKNGANYNFDAKLTKNALDQFVQTVTSE